MEPRTPQAIADEWVPFQGGELEGRPPRVLCRACRDLPARAGRERRRRAPGLRTLCFQCYRAELERNRAIAAAAHVNTASHDRFQGVLPFEPVDRPRLEMLKAERTAARMLGRQGAGRFTEKQKRAQIAARHALQQALAGLPRGPHARADLDRAMASAIHAAELQLPDSWIPFVVAR